jgi:hypothetical protein
MMSLEVGMLDQYGFASTAQGNKQASTQFVRYWEIGEYAKLLQQLECFLDSVLETNQIPFEIRHQWGRQQAVRNPLGVSEYRNLAGFLPLCGQFMDLYWPQYSYSADLQLFFDCFRQHPFGQLFGCTAPGGFGDKVLAASLYNDFVCCLRMEAVRQGVKKWLSDWRGNVWAQEVSITRYLDDLQTRYRLLVPVRVDLYYADYAADDGDALERTGWVMSDAGVWMPGSSTALVGHGRLETRARIDSAVAMGDRDRFFENRRGADRALFDRLVGYIWKLEQGGRHRANHFHCLFLFDAASLTQAVTSELKYRIAERWRGVTRGQGLMYDCHARPDRAEIKARGQWAIDRIDSAVPMQAATFINYVVHYFAKDNDQMVRIKPTARARTLTMGQMPMTAARCS